MTNDKPPCPCCNDRYQEFVEWDDQTMSVTGLSIERYARLCTTGLGCYLHE